MVAEQVKALSDKEVEVLETRTLPEGLAALLSYNATQPLADNIISMRRGITRVKTGLVTYATRDTVIKGSEVKQGMLLGLAGDEIVTSGQDIKQTALTLIRAILAADSDIITIFYGQDIPQAEAFDLTAAVKNDYPDLEVELQYGGQPIYYYIFSVE